MLKTRHALLFGLMALIAPWNAPAHAQDALGLGYGYLFGYGATNTPSIRSFVPAPPYFALHPPVYYGQRYTRPYGVSPFASWPQLQPATGYQPRPAAAHAQVITNPHAACNTPDCQPAVPFTQAQRAVEPLVIDNPYYAAAEAARLVSQESEGNAASVAKN